MYDVIVIGAGPAGLSGAVYAARKKLNTLVLSVDLGGQASESWEIENYLGFTFLTGAQLAKHFRDHLESIDENNKEYDLEFKEGVAVKKISPIDGGYEIEANGKKYQTKVVLIASGKVPRQIHIEDMQKFVGKGVSYCATCDAPVYKKKNVAVIGGGNSALEAALQLQKIATQVYVVNISPELIGDEVMQEKLKAAANVEILNSYEIVGISGEKFVSGITVKEKFSSKERKIEVAGVFVEIGSVPSTQFCKDIVDLNEKGEIKIDARTNQTSKEGIYAAGDVTDVLDKQIIIAAGEGAKAALRIYSYLAKKK